ncbi:myosin heavy chain 9/10/11/14 [Pancytospora philotis]|nr:myosin heavy chain 9/10/11/14 [Pancytospora philotis]
MSESDAKQKKWVWVPSASETYKAGYVVEEDGDTVRVQSSALESFRAAEVFRMNPSKFDRVENLSMLSHLNEPSVLHNLEMRYEDARMYTYSGLFLLALNPYRSMNMYGDEVKLRVMREKNREGAPHIYGIANEAYRAMLTNRANQSILITGESGAGKTENTKKVIEFLSYVSKIQHASNGEDVRPAVRNTHVALEEVLGCTNPVLEAFGNAKTVKNDNSSRFGKFIQVKFRGGCICGAKIEKYLLEKSRVSSASPAERNFHVFYYLLAGCRDDMLARFGLVREPESYGCLRGKQHQIDGVDDAREFEVLCRAFSELGLSEGGAGRTSEDYFRTVAAVLHLSNVVFTEADDRAVYAPVRTGQDAYDPLDWACKLLSADYERLKAGLLSQVLRAGTERLMSYRTAEQARAVLDGLMKTLYESLFDDLVGVINRKLDAPCDNYIGILDIAGFEIFKENSFEQLCINYTNEKLQQFFNHHMFVLEQEIYRAEAIEWDFIDFGLDLQPTINTIESYNPIGIFSYLDEECVMPRATDKTLLDKLNHVPHVEAVPFRDAFAIKHYAGRVEYEVSGWLRKNKDSEAEGLLSDTYCSRQANSIVKRGSFKTVAQSHREGLKWLMETLKTTQPHFVRCILPNLHKSPESFNRGLVLDQLRCNGVLEGIRISRLGYPTRLSFSSFNARYNFMLNDSDDTQQLPIDLTRELVSRFKLNKNSYKIGKTLVFFRQGVMADLEELREHKIRHLAHTIQMHLREMMAKRRETIEEDRKRAVLLIQRNARQSLQLLRWKWWSLFLKVQPLLDVKKSENSIKALQSQLDAGRRRAEDAEEALRAKDKVLEGLQLQIEELRDEIARRCGEIGDKEALLESLRGENSKIPVLRDEHDRLSLELHTLRENLSNLESKCGSCEEELAQAQIRIQTAESSLAKREEELAFMVKQDLGNVLCCKENELADLKEKLAEAERARIELEKAAEGLKRERDVLVRENGILSTNQTRLETDIERIGFELSQSIETLQTTSAASAGMIAKLKDENSDLQLENDQLTAKVDQLECAVSDKEESLKSLAQELKYQTIRNSGLEASIQSLKSIKEVAVVKEAAVPAEASAESAGLQSESSKMAKTVSSLRAKLEHEKGMSAKLAEERDSLYKENIRLMQSKLDEMFSTESEFKAAKAAMQADMRRLEAENQRLKKELADAQTASDSSEDLGFERMAQLLDEERKQRKLMDLRVIELENANLKVQNDLRLAETENEMLKRDFAAEADQAKSLQSIAALRKDLSAAQQCVQTVAETFQVEFFNVLAQKDEFYAKMLDESASELAAARLEIGEQKRLKEELSVLLSANERLSADYAGLTAQAEALRVGKKVADTTVQELRNHIVSLEEAYNERESTIAAARQDYLIAREAMEAKSRECDEAIRAAREKIADKCRKGFDEALRAAKQSYAAKLSAMGAENEELSTKLSQAESDVLQLRVENEELGRVREALKGAEEACVLSPAFASAVPEKLVSSFIVDKESLKANEWKQVVAEKCVRCKAGDQSTVAASEVNTSACEIVKLNNQKSLLELRLAQAERAVEDSQKIIEGMRSCMVVLRKNKAQIKQ